MLRYTQTVTYRLHINNKTQIEMQTYVQRAQNYHQVPDSFSIFQFD